MSVIDVAKLMPPPSGPNEAPQQHEWLQIEAQLGTSLPADYKDFISLYGTGKIDNFLWIFNPLSQNENINIATQFRVQLGALSELQAYGEVLPYKLFPEPDGIFPFGITENGDVLYWKTSGSPEAWTVLVNEARSPEWEAFSMVMTEFLFNVLNRQIHPSAFPNVFPSSTPAFVRGH
jgi:hypothetical protein